MSSRGATLTAAIDGERPTVCELLGMSANVPTDIRFSFAGLSRRGGATGPNGDGWGIAFYEGPACRSFHDPGRCCESDIARLVRECPIKSRSVIAHVRRANRGRVSLANTHPFTRELWGRIWAFAHNGQLKGIKRRPLGRFRPVGTTDSEYAFCWLLGELAARFEEPPRPSLIDAAVRSLLASLAPLGVLNVLLSEGRSLYAHCGNRLAYITRRAPFGPATLSDDELLVDFAAETTPSDVVTIVATRPLTRDEAWTELRPGELLVLSNGEPRRKPRKSPAERPHRKAARPPGEVRSLAA